MKKQNKNTDSFSELLDWLSNNPDIASGKSSCMLLDEIAVLIEQIKNCSEYYKCFEKPVIGADQKQDEDSDFLEDDYIGDDEDDEIPGVEDLNTSDRNNKKKKKRTKKG